MSKRVRKVKVHRFYKNSIAIMMILIGLTIIALMVLNIQGIGPSFDLFSLINELSDKVANGENLLENLPENLDIDVLKFSTDYDGQIYFRNASLGDWNSPENKFDSPDLYRSVSVSPLSFYPDKAASSEEKYHIDISMQSTLQKELVVDYSTYSSSSNNDCYLKAKKKNNSYSMDFSPMLDYEEAKGKSFSKSNYSNLENSYQNHVNREYLSVSPELKSRLEKFSSDNGLDKFSPTIIEDVADFLKTNYSYNLNVPSSNGEDNIMYFLETSKKGICNNFAAASTMLYRTFGIPARFVNGFLAKGLGDGSEQTLTMISAHSWTEVYIYGSGWYKVDTTSERWDLDYPYDYDPTNPPNPLVPPEEDVDLPSFQFKNISTIYDGEKHSPEEFKDKCVIAENLPEGYTYEVKFSNNVKDLTNAGVYTYLVSLSIYDQNGENITPQFANGQESIIKGPMLFEIKPRPIIISSSSANYELGNNLYVENDTEIISKYDSRVSITSDNEVDTSFGVVPKDLLIATKKYNSFSEIGNYSNDFSISIVDGNNYYEDVLKNYSISFSYGEIKVT